MRAIFVFAALLFTLAVRPALATEACNIPLEGIIQSQPYFTEYMKLHSNEDGVMSFQHRDDPRIVATISMGTPASSFGLSKNSYIENYKREIEAYVDSVREEDRRVETAYFALEPLSWKIVEEKSVPSIGPVFEGKMDIRFSETCLLQAAFLSPDSTSLRTRWYELNSSVAQLRYTASSFIEETAWEPEDTTPIGGLALLVGFIAPSLVIALIYYSVSHLSRFGAPPIGTKIGIISVAILAVILAFIQRQAIIDGLSVLKYTDTFLMLTACFLVCVTSMAYSAKVSILALITGGVTGLSLMSSSFIGWTDNPALTGYIGISMLIVSLLGFLIWQTPIRVRRLKSR